MQRWLRFLPWLRREPSQEARETAAPEPAYMPPEALAAGFAPPAVFDRSRFSGCSRSVELSRRSGSSCLFAAAEGQQLLRRSLALAHMTYTLDIVPFLAAGWRDFSFQIDDVLESGQSRISTAADEDFLRLANLERMQRARAALESRNPLVQLLAALRQRERSDTVKAVCMMHPLPGGRQLLAIGFMGTGKRFYDWFSNLRMGQEDGFHQGFSQLCDRFEQAAEAISFPETALALGLPGLTLRDVLTELARPESRFRLWMAGHSQGGAVMQLFTHRLLHRYGVLPGHLCGVGFASPTVAAADRVEKPWAYPLWHVRNREDVVCRVGAQVHLGCLLDHAPDAAFRAQVYRRSPLPADAACREWLSPWLGTMRDNGTTLLALTALLLCIAQEKGEDVLNSFAERYRTVPAMEKLFAAADDRTQSMLRLLANRQRRAYREQTGQEMDEDLLLRQIELLRPYVQKTPLRRILSVMGECLLQPHQLGGDAADPGAYSLITMQRPSRLTTLRWAYRCGQPVRVLLRDRRSAIGRRAACQRGKMRLRGLR